MLGIDKGAGAALLLGLGHDLQRQRRLARRLGAINFDDAALGQAADAQRDIEPQRTGRNRLDIDLVVGAEPHDRPLAEGLVDLRQSLLQRLLLVHSTPFEHRQFRAVHDHHPIPRPSAVRLQFTKSVLDLFSRIASPVNHVLFSLLSYARRLPFREPGAERGAPGRFAIPAGCAQPSWKCLRGACPTFAANAETGLVSPGLCCVDGGSSWR